MLILHLRIILVFSYRKTVSWVRDLHLQLRTVHVKDAIAKQPFMTLVWEVAQDYQPDFRWQASAVVMMYESTERYAIRLTVDSNKLAMHTGRLTIQLADIRLVCKLRGEEPVKDK